MVSPSTVHIKISIAKMLVNITVLSQRRTDGNIGENGKAEWPCWYVSHRDAVVSH